MKRTGGPNFNTQIFTWLKQKVIVRAERVNVQVSLQRSLQNPLKKRPNPNFHRGKKRHKQSFSFKKKLKSKIPPLTKQEKSFLLEREKHAACTLPRERLEAETGTGRIGNRQVAPEKAGWSVIQGKQTAWHRRLAGGGGAL